MLWKFNKDQLPAVLERICQNHQVFALQECDDGYHLVQSDTWRPETHTLGAYRPVEPLKSLVFRPRMFLGPVNRERSSLSIEPRVVIGVKNCDVSALKVHDHVFLNMEPADPYYAEARDKTLVVSCDCTDCRDVCFCPAVKEQPYVKEGFDINLSPVEDFFIIEGEGERGEKVLHSAEEYFQPADEESLRKRDEKRSEMYERAKKVASEHGLEPGLDFQRAIKESIGADLWQAFAEDCVECGACNFVCCTCHCFLLSDGKTKQNVAARVKQWDSCLYKAFARVGGGANPRPLRAERLYNRFDKKFNYFPDVLGTYACDGCGRCIEACTGKIDLREVLKKALK